MKKYFIVIPIILAILGLILFLIFKPNNGKNNTVDEVEKGKTVSKIKDPIRTNYKFLGWYLNNKEYNFKNQINSNITLEAKWEKIPKKTSSSTKPLAEKFKITFKPNNGEADTLVEVEKNNLVTKPVNPIYTGHTFSGWFLAEKLFDFATPITSDIVLNAKWQKDIAATDLDIKVIAGKSTLYFGGPAVTLQANLLPANATTAGTFNFEIIGDSKNKVTYTVNGDKITVTPKATGTIDFFEDLMVSVKFNGKFGKTYKLFLEEKLDIDIGEMGPITCNADNSACQKNVCSMDCSVTFYFNADIVNAKLDLDQSYWTATIDKDDNRVVGVYCKMPAYKITVTSRGGQKKTVAFHVENIMEGP